jgi:hypothetical protein
LSCCASRADRFQESPAKSPTLPNGQVARSVLCDSVYLTDYAEAGLHLRGLPTRTKIKELHEYWFDSGHPIVVELGS